MEELNHLALESAAKGSWIAIAAVVIWGVIQLLKLDKIPITIPARARPVMALILGQLFAGLLAVVGGTPWPAALLSGFVATIGAVGGHEVVGSAKKPSNPVGKRDLPEDGPPSGVRKAPPGGPLMMLVLTFVLGCSGTLTEAVTVADGAHLAGETARPLIEEHCIEAVATAADIAALRRICDPILVAWDGLRLSHATLRVAILAVQAGTAGLSTLAIPVAQVGAAALDLNESVATLRGAR